jgi:hypothetical protein
VLLPPYCPGSNPIERVWRDLKDESAWEQVADLDAQQVYLGHLLRAYEVDTLPALTGYPEFVEAIHALCA